MNKKDLAIEYLKGIQLSYLKVKYGFDYEPNEKDFTSKDGFYSFVDKYINSKIDLSENEKIEVEIELKNEVLNLNLLNTEFENFTTWKILQTAYENFLSLNPDFSFNDNDNLFLGTVSSNEINAEFISKKDNDVGVSFILFDDELTTAILLLSKIIIQSLPIVNKPPFIKFPIDLTELFNNVQLDEKIRERILNTLYFSICKRPSLSKDYLLENDFYELLVYKLIESTELFIISHEIGHFIDEDVYNEKSNLNTDKIDENWRLEFEADLFGLNQLIKLYRKKQNNYFSLLGPEIYFNFLVLYENLKSGLNSETHPPASQRLEYYRQFLSNFLSEKEQSDFSLYQEIIDKLFEYYKFVLNDFIKFNKKK